MSNRQQQYAQLRERLRDPIQLRVLIAACLLAIAYGAVYAPLDHQIHKIRRQTHQQQELLSLANDVEYLRAQVEMVQERLPKHADTNNWIQYVLEGTRQFPLKLLNLDSEKTRRVGTYEAVVLRVDLEGTPHDLDRFAAWLETNDRVFRIDAVKLAPHREKAAAATDGSSLVMQLTVLGLNSKA